MQFNGFPPTVRTPALCQYRAVFHALGQCLAPSRFSCSRMLPLLFISTVQVLASLIRHLFEQFPEPMIPFPAYESVRLVRLREDLLFVSSAVAAYLVLASAACFTGVAPFGPVLIRQLLAAKTINDVDRPPPPPVKPSLRKRALSISR